MIQEHHLNTLLEQQTRIFLGIWEPTFIAFSGLFSEFLTPSTLGSHNFLNFIQFLTIFNAPKALVGGVQVFFRHQRQWSPPHGLAFEHLSVIVITQLRLKDLTHMFCLRIPCYKLYKEGLFSHIFTLKYKCHFGMSSKKLNLKAKKKF